MKVHLLRSPEFNEDSFYDVLNVLESHPGNISFIPHSNILFSPHPKQKEWKEKIDFTTQNVSYSIIGYDGFNKDDLKFPFIEHVFSWEELFDVCKSFRTMENIPEDDAVFLLTDHANDKNWFGSVDDTMRNVFIQTSHWTQFFQSQIDHRFPIAYEIMAWVLRIHVYKDLNDIMDHVHLESKGCVNDFCSDKTQIILKMRTADVCLDCIEGMMKAQINRQILNQILKTFEGIRSNMLFRERSQALNEPSRLEIRGDNKRIFLVDFGDLEVRLNPKEKTVFLFFLNHPEGVRIVDLQDHREEITDLYAQFSVRVSLENTLYSIDNLLNPSEENIHQVMTRIRSKFKQLAGEPLATHYFIQGQRNETFKILLDRRLVTTRE